MNKDNVDAANTCLAQFGNKNPKTFEYSCDLNTCEDGKCPNHNRCKIENGKYYNDAGNIITKEEVNELY